MIYGIGTDICDVRRIRAALERHGERFATKVLGPTELAIWHQRHRQSPERAVRYLATRFAAKEALGKAIGLGVRPPMTLHNCEILNRDNGQPAVLLHGTLQAWFAERGLSAHVSVSDETDFATGFVVVERKEFEPCNTSKIPPSATPI